MGTVPITDISHLFLLRRWGLSPLRPEHRQEFRFIPKSITQWKTDQVTESSILEGTVERIVFHNPQNQWTVANFKVEASTGPSVTIVGALAGIKPGTPLQIRGKWIVDPKFGKQFSLESYQTKSPQTLLGVERYLGSGFIPGIGPEYAKRIVAQFGMDTLTVIEKTPWRLKEVEGIGAGRLKKIIQSWQSQRDLQDVMIFLRGYGVSPAYASRIFDTYGKKTISIIRANPYRLALDIWGIGFATADALAKDLGLDHKAEERLEAGLVHVLGIFAGDGHTHTPEQDLLDQTAELLQVSASDCHRPLDRLQASQIVVRENLGNNQCVSLQSLWEVETESSELFASLLSTPGKNYKTSAAYIQQIEATTAVLLSDKQRQAVNAALLDKCVVITGGPGVGKTTIVRFIVACMEKANNVVKLAAPTGRAAKRLSASTNTLATTIHRLLEYQPSQGGFQRNQENPLELDALIVDEFSMVDTHLFGSLLQALPPKAQLICVGDIDQLPSIGPGAVLDDIIQSDTATVVRLDHIYRQKGHSDIIAAAHRINRGEMPELSPKDEATKDDGLNDFYFIEREEPQSVVDTIVELVATRIPSTFSMKNVLDIQVLCPMHRGTVGTHNINLALQNATNPQTQYIARGDVQYRYGDKVMQIKNDYDKRVYNGDIGAICHIDTKDKKLHIDFQDGRIVVYQNKELDQIMLAYAVSVHKSQGSEYPAVVIALTNQHYMMLRRNLIYTAITRGKGLVCVVGSKRALQTAIKNNTQAKRHTWLAHRIRAAVENESDTAS